MLGLGSRNGATAKDVAAIQQEVGQLMRDLESRLRRLNVLTRDGASHATRDASELISETLTDVADRLRKTAQSVSEDAAQMGGKAIHRIEEEITSRPFAALAIVAALGFLVGVLGRRGQGR
jgi:ElaB/YqjD/DUF883 family membrane-anchored ribosome-binding protein